MIFSKIKNSVLILFLICISVNLHCDDSKAGKGASNHEVDAKYFDTHVLKMYVSKFYNVPSYWFEKGSWKIKDLNTYISGGKKEIVSRHQLNFIKSVRYYCYKNKHPLDDNYYTASNKKFLKRFYFFRFTGKTMIPWIDVYLFALDLKTGLFFSYALPSRFDKVWGHYVPISWQTIESHEYVKKHFPGTKFYEFDPVGYIGDDGKIVMYEWISKQNALKGKPILNYVPNLGDYKNVASKSGPGYSPYRKK